MPLFAVLLLFAAEPVPYTSMAEPPPTPLVKDWLALCDRSAAQCEDRLFDLTWENSVGDKTVGYCLPKEGETPAQITDKVRRWLAARPETLDDGTNPGTDKALRALYPCR